MKEHRVKIGKKNYIIDLALFKDGEIEVCFEIGSLQADKFVVLQSQYNVIHLPYGTWLLDNELEKYFIRIHSKEEYNKKESKRLNELHTKLVKWQKDLDKAEPIMVKAAYEKATSFLNRILINSTKRFKYRGRLEPDFIIDRMMNNDETRQIIDKFIGKIEDYKDKFKYKTNLRDLGRLVYIGHNIMIEQFKHEIETYNDKMVEYEKNPVEWFYTINHLEERK